MMKRVILILTAVLISAISLRASQTVKVGETINLYCTASAPAGYITHAFFSFVDPEDAGYLRINAYNGSDLMTTVTGLSPKANIKIAVTYAYSYTGSYDNRTHVGHGTYYEYVTVSGEGRPKSVVIVPADAKMGVGETIELRAQVTPAGASATYDWGIIETLGRPFNFNMSVKGPVATITAKGAGKLYLVLYVGELLATAIVTAENKDIPLESISFDSPELVVSQGKTVKAAYTVSPAGANTPMSWSSSNEAVATVSSKGVVTGVSQGKCKITLTAENGVSESCDLEVLPSATGISLSDESVSVGYSFRLTPIVIPIKARPEFVWQSSNENVVSVLSDGSMKAKKAGTVIIKVEADSGVKAACTVTVNEVEKGCETRNVLLRVKEVKQTVEKALDNNR